MVARVSSPTTASFQAPAGMHAKQVPNQTGHHSPQTTHVWVSCLGLQIRPTFSDSHECESTATGTSSKDRGVGTIQKIARDSPAAFSGHLAIGDSIVAVDDEHVTCFGRLLSLLQGDCRTLVRLQVREIGGGSAVVCLMRQEAEHQHAGAGHGHNDNGSVGMVGLQLEAVPSGMRIVAFSSSGPAQWSHLQLGDTILRFVDCSTRELVALSSRDQMQHGPVGSRVRAAHDCTQNG
jgi:C-terminal processing protease CtpA/Prc